MTRPVGFVLVELLVALAVCSVIVAGIAAVVPPSSAAFERTPAALDAQQRGRTAVDALMRAVRSAGVAGFVPAVVGHSPVPDGRFLALLAIARRPHAAQGVLAADQDGVAGALVLSDTPCPDAGDVCGFSRGATAVVADGTGHFEVFIVDDTDSGTHSITSAREFGATFPAGALVLEVDALTFRLDTQADGSHTLVRETAAGAIQPIADRVRDLSFTIAGRRLDARMTVESAGALGTRTYRVSTFMRNGS